jgi:predicted enzyme related to lactoylglutathione lyase
MKLGRMDHVAIEVSDLEARIERLCRTGGLKLLRRGFNKRTGERLAMVGDGTGMKLELIENPEAKVPRFVHVAFRAGDVQDALALLQEQGWEHLRGPNDLAEAQARSALFQDPDGFELQVLSYAPTSPDIVEWDNTVIPSDNAVIPSGVEGQRQR